MIIIVGRLGFVRMFRERSLVALGLCIALCIVTSIDAGSIPLWYRPSNYINPRGILAVIGRAGKSVRVECDKGTTIKVVGAFYGRAENTKCRGGNFLKTKAFVAKECKDKRICNLGFGLVRRKLKDPCPKIRDKKKYLIVEYVCSSSR